MNKLNANYWKKRVFQPTYTHNGEQHQSERWIMQIAHAGRRKKVTLPTSNQTEAARMAADFYKILLREGWIAAERWLDPDAKVDGDKITVGQWIEHIAAMNVLGSRTLLNYTNALRWFGKELGGIAGDKSRFDYKGGGNKAFRELIEAVPISDFTSAKIQRVIDAYVHRRSTNPLEAQTAAKSVRSYVANARGLFSKKLRKRVTLPMPNPLPFQELELPDKGSSRYISSVNAEELVAKARAELRETRPAEWIAFLLGLGAGLRRGEMSALTWLQVRWEKGAIWVHSTEHFATKTEGSDDVILLDGSLIKELRWWQSHASAPTEFVLPGRAEFPKAGQGWRCDDQVFYPLIAWLRSHGVKGNKPLHILRKEFGCFIAEHADIHVAQSQLRHAQISTTASFYTENRRRVAPSFGTVPTGPRIEATA